MLQLDADVRIDIKEIEDKFTEPNYRRARYALGNQMLADMNKYVPFKGGPLRQSTSIDIDGRAVHYHQIYARYQFYNQFSNYTTPGTGPRWDKKAQSNHGNDWKKAFVKGAGLD